MRTTLDIADDVLMAAKESAGRDKTSVGAVISDLARRTLLRPQEPAISGTARGKQAEHPLHRLGILPRPKRGGVVTNELINQLRDDGIC